METNAAQLPLGDKAWAWFEANKKPVAWAAALIAAVGLIVWFVLWQHEEKEVAAGNALSNVETGLAAGGTRADSADAYLGIAAKYPGSSAGARALLLAGGSFFTDGKYPEAQAQFERFSREYRESPFMGEALLGIAASLDAAGKTNQAMTAYQNLIERHPGETVVPQAKFALARLDEAQNKPEAARDLYDQVERADPYGSLGDEARMRLEDLKAKYPNLAPAAPAAPTAPKAPAAAKAPPALPKK